jgi:diguanylate cyclase (GGDEF)-like protein
MEVVRIGRAADYICMHIWILPLLVFVYSVTRERRKIYLIYSYLLTLFDIALFLFFRYVCGFEPAFMEWQIIIYYMLAVVLFALMLYNDYRYCKANNLSQGHKFFYIGLSVLMVSAAVDILIYLSGVRSVSGRGGFARVGFIAFFVMMALDAIHSWKSEQTSIRRERLIHKMLQFSVSANDPEVSLRAMIEHLGREFLADHVYIYENRNDGTFHNTYEWYAEGVAKPDDSFYYDVPYAGMIDKLYDVFMRDHRLIVDNSETTRRLNPMLHELIKKLGIHKMVVGPLEFNGELIGLIGADDLPEEKCDELAEVIWLMSYFITQLIMQRNEKRNLLRFSYVDSLTGVGNRRAMVDFEVSEREFKPYGYVMCDINGLKKTNDTLGHEAGDRLIIDVAHSLMDVFGENNVYRIGGDEFVAYAFTDSSEQFYSMLSRAKTLIQAKGGSASFGALYVADSNMTRSRVREQADALMYREKEQYYNGANDRRSR